MCGILGILHRGKLGDASQRIVRMADAIVHRGPDDAGYWSGPDIELGFRRLSIVDIEGGHQPMTNEDGTVHVVFNGEIYNHVALRRELENKGHRFASDHSDTEVLVHGYEEWGEQLAERLNGMFAFAVWDTRQRRLMLGRDRLGIKPLYLAELADGTVVFGSEIRGIHASGLVPVAPDHQSVYAYFLQQNVWRGRSLFKGVRLLEPGHIFIDEPAGRRDRQFWDISFNRRKLPRADAAAALRETLQGAIKRQLAADVPVMGYLSGGIDSSSLVAGAYRQDPGVRAYSCIFNLDQVGDDKIVDEREFSRLVAADLGIKHIELELPQLALTTSLHRTVAALEEPRMGMAYVNYLIAERVAADSKVVLSGCGGDEILGGYVSRYDYVRQPFPPEPAQARSWFDRLLGRGAGSPANPLADAFKRMQAIYSYPVGTHEIEAALKPEFRAHGGGYSLEGEMKQILANCPSEDIWDRLLYIDAKTYLAGLLMVEDKLSMAHSLETRVPLLDNEVIDLALSYDWSVLTDGETGKIAFRDAIRDWVPPQIADKPKMGFGPPDASWYRGALQPFVRKVLSPERIAARGVFDPAFVAQAIDWHMSGAQNRLPLIWSLLSFDAWCESSGVYGGDLGEPLNPHRMS